MLLPAAAWTALPALALPLLGGDLLGSPIEIVGQLIGPRVVHAADLDGDGDKDVLSGSTGNASTDNRLVWFENTDGAGTTGPLRLIGAVDGLLSVSAEDLDGDGDLDVIAAGSYNAQSGGFYWFENESGVGTFGPPITIDPVRVDDGEAADFDGDGELDLTWIGINDVFWSENLGAATFGVPQGIGALAFGELLPADLDGDGDVDICAGHVGDLLWFENELDNGGGFAARVDLWSECCMQSRALHDLDMDGDVDWLVTRSGEDDVFWLPNSDGLGTPGPLQVISTALDSPRDAIAADIDADGDPDVVSADRDDSKLAWYANDGTGVFGGQVLISTGVYAPLELYAADLDGDPGLEVLAVSDVDADVAWFENVDGLGSFGPKTLVAVGLGDAQTSFAVDLDGDDDPDAVSASWDRQRLSWYENLDGAGSFGPPSQVGDLPDVAFALATDVDTDGDLDLMAANTTHLRWYDNDGTGVFLSKPVGPAPSTGIRAIAAGDLTGDGAPEALMATSTNDFLGWRENTDGLGSFGPPIAIASSAAGVRWIDIGDIDGDGALDALSASIFDNMVAWYRNTDGAGTFGPPQAIPASSNPARLEVGDVDGDGDLDVLHANLDDDIRWSENTSGAGQFGFPELIDDDSVAISSLELGDLDGDGDSDLLSTLYYPFTGRVALFENLDGDGTFSALQVLAAVAEPKSVALVDIDLDGDQDAIVTSLDRVSWYPNEKCSGTSVASAAVVRVGAPPNPEAFSASGPVIGTTWQPALDHAAFVPTALADLLIASFGPWNVDLGGAGTLLCDLTAAPVVTMVQFDPGVAFSIPINHDCSIVGADVCVQGASVDATGALHFANALDLTIGSY